MLNCNIGKIGVDIAKLSRVIRNLDVDIVCLQECPRDLQQDLPSGWHELQPGGISIFSKYPVRQLKNVTGMHLPDTWPRNSLLPTIIESPFGNIAFNGIHLPTARFGILNMLDRRMWINFFKTDVLAREIENRLHVAKQAREAVDSQQLPCIIAGDFNMPVESRLYQDFWGDMNDAFESAGRGYGWTSSEQLHCIAVYIGIDHILTQRRDANYCEDRRER